VNAVTIVTHIQAVKEEIRTSLFTRMPNAIRACRDLKWWFGFSWCRIKVGASNTHTLHIMEQDIQNTHISSEDWFIALGCALVSVSTIYLLVVVVQTFA